MEEVNKNKTLGELNKEKSDWDKYEKKLYDNEKRNRKGRKALRCRYLKNFLFFLAGLLCCVVLIAGTLAAGIFVIPVGSYLKVGGVSEEDSKNYVTDENKNKSLFGIIKSLTEIQSINDASNISPYIKTQLEELLKVADDFVSYDKEALYSAKFSEYNDIQNKINLKIIATLDSLNATDMLGDLKNLSAFQTGVEVYLSDGVTTATKANIGEVTNYKLYNYKDADGNFVAACNEKGDGWSDALSDSEPLYYASLASTGLSDVTDIISDRMGVIEVVDVLGVFTTVEKDSLISKIFKKTTVKDMGSFDVNGVELSNFINRYEADGVTETKIYSILRSAYGVDSEKDITVGDLNSAMTFNNVLLSDVIEESGLSSDLKKIMNDVIGKPYGEITVGDLSLIDVGAIKLSTVIDEYEESYYTKYEVGTPEYDTAKTEYDNNARLWKILRSAITYSGEEILVGDAVKNFSTDNIMLKDVLASTSDNKGLTDILTDVTGKEYSDISLSDLATLDVGKVKLSTVIKEKSAGEAGYEENRKLWAMLKEAVTPSDGTDILLSDLSDGFDIGNVKLSTVVGETSGNVFLDALLKDGNVTVGNVSEKMNALKISDVYNVESFTTEIEKAVQFNSGVVFSYKKEGDKFVKSGTAGEDGKLYYVNKEAGVWTLMCYSVNGTDSDGFATEYVINDVTAGNMKTKIDEMAHTLENFTIRQLVVTGLLAHKGTYEKIEVGGAEVYVYPKTLSEALG